MDNSLQMACKFSCRIADPVPISVLVCQRPRAIRGHAKVEPT